MPRTLLFKCPGDPTGVPAPLRDDALRAAPRDLLHLPQDLQAQVQPRLPPEAVTQLTEEQDIGTVHMGTLDRQLCTGDPRNGEVPKIGWRSFK